MDFTITDKTTQIDAGWGIWRIQTLSGGEDVVEGRLLHLLTAGLVMVTTDTQIVYSVNAGAFENALLLEEDSE